MTTHSALAGAPASAGRAWHYGLWAAQLVLAVMFSLASFPKLTLPPAELAVQFPYTVDLPLALVRFIGVAELAAVLGLILPAATRIRPGLTPMAAVGLTTIMVLASAFHISRGEWSALPVTLPLGLLALLVVWGRTRKARIAPRG
jgi:putative oxidoreductase